MCARDARDGRSTKRYQKQTKERGVRCVRYTGSESLGLVRPWVSTRNNNNDLLPTEFGPLPLSEKRDTPWDLGTFVW